MKKEMTISKEVQDDIKRKLKVMECYSKLVNAILDYGPDIFAEAVVECSKLWKQPERKEE